jgi:hypothetical protein
MPAILYTDYFSIAHNETRSSVPSGIRAIFLSLFGRNRKNFGQYLIERISTRLLKDFGALSLELEGIHVKLLNGELSAESVNDDFKTLNKIIKLLTKADELFNEVDYFDSVLLKREVKNTLNTSYLIEVELKDLVFKHKKNPFLKDEMFHALASKSKDSIVRSI